MVSSSSNGGSVEVLKSLRFGIEIETVGLNREAVALAIQSALPGSRMGVESVTEAVSGRTWKVVPDGSLNGYTNGEIVSPILGYADLDVLQNIVRAVRAAGATVDESCGIHVHVDGARFDARSVVNLVKLVHRHEALLQHVLGVSERRAARYCRPVNPEFIARIERSRPTTLADVNAAWYGQSNPRPTRYDSSRYHGLNLNSLFFRGTIEFRYFSGTLHAGKVKAFVQLALALAARALTSKAAVGKAKPFNANTARYASRIFLKLLGLTGAEFKTARHHFTAHLAGSCNYRGVAPVAVVESDESEPSAEPSAEPSETSEQGRDLLEVLGDPNALTLAARRHWA